jgi:hypothetical protein
VTLRWKHLRAIGHASVLNAEYLRNRRHRKLRASAHDQVRAARSRAQRIELRLRFGFC